MCMCVCVPVTLCCTLCLCLSRRVRKRSAPRSLLTRPPPLPSRLSQPASIFFPLFPLVSGEGKVGRVAPRLLICVRVCGALSGTAKTRTHALADARSECRHRQKVEEMGKVEHGRFGCCERGTLTAFSRWRPRTTCSRRSPRLFAHFDDRVAESIPNTCTHRCVSMCVCICVCGSAFPLSVACAFTRVFPVFSLFAWFRTCSR